MFLIAFLSFFITRLDIQPFEVSQRLKGLGIDFSHIIIDSVTDLIYEPILTTFLPNSMFLLGVDKGFSIGYFSPSIFTKFSGTICMESNIDKLSL